MRYLSIDIETTGLDPKRCSMIELAMVLEDTSINPLPPVEALPSFAVIVAHDEGMHWEPYCLYLHRERLLPALIHRATSRGVMIFDGLPILSSHEATLAAGDFLFANGINPGSRITAAGKNFAGFDSQFLPKEITGCLYHRVLDPGSVCVDWGKDKLLGLDELTGTPVAHGALADARDVVRVLRRKYAVQP